MLQNCRVPPPPTPSFSAFFLSSLLHPISSPLCLSLFAFVSCFYLPLLAYFIRSHSPFFSPLPSIFLLYSLSPFPSRTLFFSLFPFPFFVSTYSLQFFHSYPYLIRGGGRSKIGIFATNTATTTEFCAFS